MLLVVHSNSQREGHQTGCLDLGKANTYVVAHDLHEAHIGELLGKPGEVRVHHLARATGFGGDLDGDLFFWRVRDGREHCVSDVMEKTHQSVKNREIVADCVLIPSLAVPRSECVTVASGWERRSTHQLVSRGRVNGVELILGDAEFHPAVADDPLRGGVASQGSAAAGA